MAFSDDDILEELAAASTQGKREYLLDGYRFGNRRDWMNPTAYAERVRKVMDATARWRQKNPERYQQWVTRYRTSLAYREWERAYAKAWRTANPEKVREWQRRKRAKIKADPVKLAARRKRDREAKRRERARKKNGL